MGCWNVRYDPRKQTFINYNDIAVRSHDLVQTIFYRAEFYKKMLEKFAEYCSHRQLCSFRIRYIGIDRAIA